MLRCGFADGLLVVFSYFVSAFGAFHQNFDYDGRATERISNHVDTYMFNTSVAQTFRIDLDLEKMVHLMSTAGFNRTQGLINLNNAKRIYMEGGHSSSHADITVSPLPRAVAEGEVVLQRTPWNGNLGGRVQKYAPKKSSKLEVSYTSVWRPCYKADTVDIMTDGAYGSEQNASSNCFSTAGPLRVIASGAAAGFDVGVPLEVTTYFRSFASFSMAELGGEKYYDIFRTFFSTDSYAHNFVNAAINGQGAFANLAHSQFRTHAVKRTIASLTVWMKVIDHMETARTDCSLHEWDRAVALYGGSQWNTLRGGYLLFGIASSMCPEFATCDEKGMSIVNNKVLQLFTEGQALLEKSECGGDELAMIKESIVQLMSVPHVQGLLRSAFKVEADVNLGSQGQAQGRDRVDGHMFALAMLPLLSTCNIEVAGIVDGMMRIDSKSEKALDFGVLKNAIESVYPCLGISCEDVGGLVNFKQGIGYLKGAAPCGYEEDLGSSEEAGFKNWGVVLVIIGSSACMLFVCCAALFYKCGLRISRKTESPTTKHCSEDNQVVAVPVAPGVVGNSLGTSTGMSTRAEEKARLVDQGVQVDSSL